MSTMSPFDADDTLYAHPNPVPPSPPPAVSTAGALLWALAALHAGVAVLIVLNRGDAPAALLTLQPDLPEAAVAGLAFTRVVGGAVIYGAAAGIFLWLGMAIRRPQIVGQWLATGVCVLGLLAGLVWAASTAQLMPNAQSSITMERQVSLALELLVIVLLWAPRRSRRFFASDSMI